MKNKRVKEIVEYFKTHPVNGFELIVASVDNNAENSPLAMLLYRAGEVEGKEVVIFIDENDGRLHYCTLFPVFSATKRSFVETAYLLMGSVMNVSDRGFRMYVEEQKGQEELGMDGYTVHFDSINRERLNSNEHKMMSTILWGTMAVHCLGQQC